jgi:hypothetical protein
MTASHALTRPLPLADARDRGKGTTVKPLDGGALSLVGNARAGERTPGGAATHLSGRHGRFSIWISHVRVLWKKGRGKRERRKGGAGCGRVPGGAALHRRRPSPAAGNTEPAAAAVVRATDAGGCAK